jgi:hypothetical protein
MWSTGGGRANCAFYDVPVTGMNKCFTTFSFINNALSQLHRRFLRPTWPTQNMFPQTIPGVQFVNYNNGDGGNYQLQTHSLYKNKGTDGKDLGADIVGLNAALANVE